MSSPYLTLDISHPSGFLVPYKLAAEGEIPTWGL